MDIVVGYINSPEGEAAVDQGIHEAKLRGGKMVVVHSMVGGGREDSEDYLRSAEAMARVEERLKAEGLDYCTHEYVRGQQPVDDIMEAVNTHDAELIVIGVRTRSATGKFLRGSNALEILHDATVPVLCVKRDVPETDED